MSNEITTLVRLNITNGVYTDAFSASPTITQNTLGANSGIQTVGTSAEALAVGDVATLGLVCLLNTDATNFVQFGPDDSGTMKVVGRLKPGEAAQFRLEPGITLKLKADTASCKVRFLLLND
ncbi:hypothetical protein [Anatilimnocola floriformis]|uniref:hypothetical protein n=1 Tax=Anatilimnocola floriformis TaxID=2948575 RepID=UPI0020C567BC|nr:hypothetical protein [Anatilimnocola floriformis]